MMKYVRMFEAVVGLFPKMIKVTLVDAGSGNGIGLYKIPVEKLPVAFNRPTMLKIQDINWRVLKADPVLADDFLITKKLTLHVQNADSIESKQLRFSLPTICRDLPATGMGSLYHDFTMPITKSDWRQIEFLSLDQSSFIAAEIEAIERVVGEQSNALLGYERQYSREITATLAIPWDSFCALVSHPVKGNIFLEGNGIVEQGFALRSDNFLYYGILENSLIRTLCLTQFNGVDDEFMRVLNTWSLLLADWCNASILSAELGEEPKNEYIQF